VCLFTFSCLVFFIYIRCRTQRRMAVVPIPPYVSIVVSPVYEVPKKQYGVVYEYKCDPLLHSELDCPKCTCSICYQSYDSQLVMQPIKCPHIFHEKCLQQSMVLGVNKTCPECRIELE